MPLREGERDGERERELGIEGAQDVMVYAHSSGPGIFFPRAFNYKFRGEM